MTQEEMIQSIQQQEARAWVHMLRMKLEFGKEHALYKMANDKFVAINQLMESLGIETDLELPEITEGLRLMQLLD